MDMLDISPHTRNQAQAPALDALLSSGHPRKLRESCTQCAGSKVKCNKVKPTCARCMRRGMSCEYGISRRTGRNRAPSTVSIPALMTPSRSPRPLSRCGTSSSVGGYFQHSRRTSSPHSSCSISNAGGSRSPTPQESPLNTPLFDTSLRAPNSATSGAPQQAQDFWTSIGSGGDELQANLTTLDFADIDPADLDSSCLLDLSHDPFTDFDMSLGEPLDDGYFSGTTDIDSNTPCIDNISCSNDSSPNNSVSKERSVGSTSSDSGIANKPQSTCCLTTIVSLMLQLSPNAATGCAMPGNQQGGSCRAYTVESVISENKQVIESITKLIDCPCSQDEYVVAIASLVVFKVMGLYAAVASEGSQVDEFIDWNSNSGSDLTKSSSLDVQDLHHPTTVGNNCMQDNEQGRMAAQLVLSELHRVSRLVNILSQRLGNIRLRNKLPSGSRSSLMGYGVGVPALSVPTFELLEQDLRKRLKAVSSETIERLRRS